MVLYARNSDIRSFESEAPSEYAGLFLQKFHRYGQVRKNTGTAMRNGVNMILADWLQLALRNAWVMALRPHELLRRYKADDLRPDLVAGLTVAVVLIPQAIAYALLTELPPQMGLYAAVVAAIFGALWGSSWHLHTGPTNAVSLLVLSSLLGVAEPGSARFIAAAGLMAVMVGVTQIFMGLMRMGVLVNFVSNSVIVGFTAGAGMLISVHQLRHLLRLQIPGSPVVFGAIGQVTSNVFDTHGFSLALGLGTITVMILLHVWRPNWPGAFIAIVLAAIAVALFGLSDRGVVVLDGLPRGLPHVVGLPFFELTLIGKLAPGALAIAAIGIVEAISISRAVANESGQSLDSNQEFVGQGLANVAAGLLSGYTCSGSFTRTAVNHASGARTPMASVFSGVWVLAALVMFSSLAVYLPRAALAGVLVIVSYRMVNLAEMRRILRSSLGDSLIMVATFLATVLFPLEFAGFFNLQRVYAGKLYVIPRVSGTGLDDHK